jgi:hypothetical protein
MVSSSEGSSLEKVTKTFEECWEELVKEYSEKRWNPIWCSEADVQLHLARKLLNRLPEGCVHIELPIPLDVEKFSWELFLSGRVSRRECIVPDIVVLNPENLRPILLAEIKFNPVYRSLYWLVAPWLYEEIIREIVKFLGNDVEGVRNCQKKGPSEQELEYFLRNVDKLIQVIKDFKSKEGETVAGYLCVIDEIYPDIEDRIKKKIAEYNPPEHFKVLAKYYPAVDVLEKAREELVKILKSSEEGH